MVSASCRPGITPIRGLLFQCAPCAVGGLIIAVIVTPINRFAFWAFAHVSKEIEKAAALSRIPSLANGDAPTSIVRVRDIARIAAAPKHRYPAPISRSSRHEVRHDASDVGLLRSFGANLLLRFFGVRKEAAARIVAGDEAANMTLIDRCHLPAAARASLCFNQFCALTMALYEALALLILIAKVWAPWSACAATARAQRRFQPMASQEVRKLVTEQVFSGNLLSATTLAEHGPIITRV